MCGIAGVIAERDVSQLLIEILKKLEYRGYDSAGIAVVNDDGHLHRLRRMGKVNELESASKENHLSGHVGIAHTRWATHGKPSVVNAHPHIADEKIALVHNGIIDNYNAIKDKLEKLGYVFTSQTDTEAIVFLINHYVDKYKDILRALQEVKKELHGNYALALIDRRNKDTLFALCQGCSLLIGLGIGENFISSDVVALSMLTDKYMIMENGEIAVLTRDSVKLLDAQLKEIKRDSTTIEHANSATDKGTYRHFMLKEIHEQDKAAADTLRNRLSKNDVIDEFISKEQKELLTQTENIQIVACGTSYNAGLIAKSWIEQIAQISCQVEIASEYASKQELKIKNNTIIAFSQSGETVDTINAFKHGIDYHKSICSISICNVISSKLARMGQINLITASGPEIGVASTKAFTTQLVAMLVLTLIIAKYKDVNKKLRKEIVASLHKLPKLIAQTIDESEQQMASVTDVFSNKNSALFLGKHSCFPIALEGALKLKEVSYIHAEAYPAGELKHGPLALIDDGFPVVAIVPDDDLRKKMVIAIESVSSRGSHVVVIGSRKIKQRSHVWQILIPKTHPILAPILFNIPLQLLAYHVACIRGNDVDQPRNLAKSVTVE